MKESTRLYAGAYLLTMAASGFVHAEWGYSLWLPWGIGAIFGLVIGMVLESARELRSRRK